MEKYELLNETLRPIDKALELSFSAMRRANLYDPFKKALYGTMKTALTAQFKLNHSIKIYGTENVPPEGGVLLAINHQSWLDAQVVTAASPRKVSFLAKAEFTSWPILRHLIDLSDAVFIRRGGDDDTLQYIAGRLKEGACIGIFPEGTIPGEEDIPRWDVDPKTGLLRGKSGVVRLALLAGVPIVPVGLTGTGAAFPPEAYPRLQEAPMVRPVPIEVRFGKPIYFQQRLDEELGYEQLRGMTRRVMKAISHLVDHTRGYEPMTLPIETRTKPTSIPETPYRNANKRKKKSRFGVLVLHGFTSHITCVSDLRFPLDEMEVPYRIPILRGHGGEWKDLTGVTAADWYEDAENSMLDLLSECRKVIVVGLSMGGLVTLELAARHRKEVHAIVTLAAALKFKDPLSALTPLMAKLFKSWPGPSSFNDPELARQRNRNYERFPTGAFNELYKYAGKVENLLSFVQSDALIIHSKKDTVIHPKASQIIFDKIGSKHKKLVWFERSGHEMLLDNEAPKVAETVMEFVRATIQATADSDD